MKRLVALGLACLTGLALAAPGTAAAADLALVVGNYDYRQAPDALSARVDARAVAETLEQGGYEVISGTDLTRSEMRRRLAQFAERLGQADRVVVFYSGHALRSGGASYLAPVEQGNGSLVEVMLDGVPLELVLRLAGHASGRAVVFVDGAQLNGFTPQSYAEPGLAHIDPPQGVLVVSAAAPGRAIARRSVRQSDFARDVIDQFLAPGNRVGRAVSRLGGPAWVGGDTDSSLVLVPEGRGPIAGGGAGTGTGTGGLTDAEIEKQLQLSVSERREIQEQLNLLGYDTRGIDGVFGPGTRTAIRNWQRANNLPVTSYLTQEQVAMITQRSGQAGTGTTGRTPAQVESQLNLTGAERSEIQENLNLLGYDTRGTGGVFGPGTRTAIRNWQRANNFEETGFVTQEQVALIDQQTRQAGTPPTGSAGPAPSDPAAAETALGLSRNDRLSVEQRLAYLGFPPGNQDGFFDADTRWAIEGYQRSRGYPATGYLDQQTVAGIVNETQGVSTGILSGANVLMDILRGLGSGQ